jgi:hypothetical protein
MRKDCNRTNRGLPKVTINEKEDIISRWKDKKHKYSLGKKS